MKKLLVTLACAACALTLTVRAADTEGKHQLTDEQKAVQKEMLAKYDTNKDGKLDKEERAKMTPEDKAAWQKAFPKKEKKSEEKSDK